MSKGNMDYLFSEESDETLVRVIEYGRPKTKKTWWAGKAAEAGFNVILLDGDNGFHILKEIPETIRNNRIVRVNCVDNIGDPVFAPFTIKLLKNKKILWNDSKKIEQLGFAGLEEDCNYMYLDLRKLTKNDVLVLDSWSQYCVSLNLRFAKENNLDLTAANKWEWDGYAYSGMLVDWTLNSLMSLPCHVVVIGHETTYEKYRGTGRNRQLVSTTIVMRSTSNPKAMTVPAPFSDTLYFFSVGSSVKIDTRAEDGRLGGSRAIPPAVYDWDKLQFTDVCKAYNISIPGNPEREYDNAAVEFFRAGEELPEEIIGKKKTIGTTTKPVEAAPIPNTISAGRTGVTLAGLMKK